MSFKKFTRDPREYMRECAKDSEVWATAFNAENDTPLGRNTAAQVARAALREYRLANPFPVFLVIPWEHSNAS